MKFCSRLAMATTCKHSKFEIIFSKFNEISKFSKLNSFENYPLYGISLTHSILTKELITTAGQIEGNLTSEANSGAPSPDDTLLPPFFFAFLHTYVNHQLKIPINDFIHIIISTSRKRQNYTVHKPMYRHKTVRMLVA